MRFAILLAAALALPPQHQHQGMGFSQTDTSHHFRLSPAGGAIEVHVHDAANKALRDAVVKHLRTIAKAFGDGDFSAPFAVHGEQPPGVEGLRARKDALSYSFEESDLGGRVVIHTADGEALRALHEFLRYQIREHKTGDSLNVLR
jgi:hypothetical protein